MSLFDKKATVPACCRACVSLDYESDEVTGEYRHYCERNIYLPTKRQSCARQTKRSMPTVQEKS